MAVQKYYKNQLLNFQMTDAAGEDLSTLTLRVDMWKPATADGATADVTVADGNISRSVGGNTAVISFTIAKDILDEASATSPWRWQLINTVNETAWETDCFYILERGSC